MAQEEIEIEIGPDGQVTVKTKGIKGPRCAEVAEALARIIGPIESQQRTSEYYEAETDVRRHVDVHHRT